MFYKLNMYTSSSHSKLFCIIKNFEISQEKAICILYFLTKHSYYSYTKVSCDKSNLGLIIQLPVLSFSSLFNLLYIKNYKT